MQKSKGKKLLWLVILICVAAGLLISSVSVQANVVCKKYKEHKRKFKSEENKKIYFKIKWVKNHDRKTYDYYRAICEPFKFDSYQFKGNLNRICHDYYIYEEYEDYLQYKKQCHKNDDKDEEEIIETEPEPQTT